MDKKYLHTLILGALNLPFIANAQLQDQYGSGGSNASLNSILGGVETVTWAIFGTITVVMFVSAGVLFVTSQGDAKKLQTARQALIWGVAGVVVGILAYSILELVQHLI